MASLKKEELKREFVIENKSGKTVLADPDPSMSPDQVMTFYANQYPELTTSAVHGPRYDADKIVYTFKTTVGTKG
jgi:PRTRC genetic system protein C